MTAVAEPLTVLDEQTIEELQPPCEVRTRTRTPPRWFRRKSKYSGWSPPCASPAEWAVTTRCACGSRISLTCTTHKDNFVFDANECPECEMLFAVKSAERLR